MDDQTATQPVVRRAAKRKAVKRPKTFWMKIRRPLAESRVVKGVVTSLFASGLRFIRLTNPPVDGSVKLADTYEAEQPGIIALWHGQHLLAPVFYPCRRGLVAMVSRSADLRQLPMLRSSRKWGVFKPFSAIFHHSRE